MNGFNTYFKIGAIKAGAPAHIVERFENVDKVGLVELYKDEIKLWITLGWPTNDELLGNVGKELMAKMNVHVDDEDFVDGGESGDYIVSGDSHGSLHFGRGQMAIVYALDDSEVLIDVDGGASVFVHVHDKAHVTVEQHGMSKVTVKSHSAECDVLTSGDVRYIDGVAEGTAEYVSLTDEEKAAIQEKLSRKFGR